MIQPNVSTEEARSLLPITRPFLEPVKTTPSWTWAKKVASIVKKHMDPKKGAFGVCVGDPATASQKYIPIMYDKGLFLEVRCAAGGEICIDFLQPPVKRLDGIIEPFYDQVMGGKGLGNKTKVKLAITKATRLHLERVEWCEKKLALVFCGKPKRVCVLQPLVSRARKAPAEAEAAAKVAPEPEAGAAAKVTPADHVDEASGE